MVHLIASLAVSASLQPTMAGEVLASHPDLQVAVSRAQRTIRSESGEFVGEQPGRFQFSATAAGRLTVDDLSIRTVAFGNGSVTVLATTPVVKLGKDEAGFSKLSFNRPGISEWYVNEAKGLHHWFKVERKVANGNLWVKLATSGAMVEQTELDSIQFKTSKNTLSYSGLKVWDANGKPLPATMQLRGTDIVLGVDDADAVYPVTIDPIWNEEAIFGASDRSADAYFGSAVSFSGNTAVVGSYLADPGGTKNAGQAYVFVRNAGTWTQQAILSASDKSANAHFGISVGIFENKIIVGARSAKVSNLLQAGQAYVFNRTGTTWSEEAILTSDLPAENGWFGTSVAISAEYAAVGESYASPGGITSSGQVLVFSPSEGTWRNSAKFIGSQKSTGANFGDSVAISGPSIVVGAFQADGTAANGNEGMVFVYRRVRRFWTEDAILRASSPQTNGRFGWSVAVSGDTIVVGAPRHSFPGSPTVSSSGQAFVFERINNIWTEQAILNASDMSGNAQFGFSVALDGEIAIIGSHLQETGGLTDAGQAYAFKRDGTVWNQDAIFSASDKAASANFGDFGYAVGISGPTAIVGAPFANRAGLRDAGQVYAYRLEVPVAAAVSFPMVGITGGKSIQGTVTLVAVQEKDTVVNLISDSALLTVPTSVTIPAGSTTVTFTATSTPVSADVTATVTTSGVNIISGSTQLAVRFPRVGSFTINAASITEGQSATATVKLQSFAPPGGIWVSLSNSNKPALDCPATVLIPEGASSATFLVRGKSVAVRTSSTVRATPSFSEKKYEIIITPLAALSSISVDDFVVGSSRLGKVTLTSAAPSGGAVVTLASSSSLLTLPASVTVPAGATTAMFTVSAANLVRNATITGTYRGLSKSDLVSTVSLTISTVSSSNTSLAIGQSATVTVTLSTVTPQDLTIVVSQQTAGVVVIPAQIVIPAGSTSGNFTISGGMVGVSNVYVKLLSQGVRGVKITITN